jgi:uncharacterized protein
VLKPKNIATGEPKNVKITWNVRIPMRDGIHLSGTLFQPKGVDHPIPCLFQVTPYIADSYHGLGVYMASHGFSYLMVDCRGRGNSEGVFWTYRGEGPDGHDIVEWIAQQPWCNGQVGMTGGSYSGFNQWVTAAQRPEHLTAIMPLVASHPGVDVPMRNNIGELYSLQWLMFMAGHTSQGNLFSEWGYWRSLWRDRVVAGEPFASLPFELGQDQANLREWIDHTEQDDYWDSMVPTAEQYAELTLPVLTVTGHYDDDQQGALEYYKRSLLHACAEFAANHFLIIGPWDHPGAGSPQEKIGGLSFGPASLLNMRGLSVEWFKWRMGIGPCPEFLQKRVAWYVSGAEYWRYAERLEDVTSHCVEWQLHPATGDMRLNNPGMLALNAGASGIAGQYVYDPADVSRADAEVDMDPFDPTDTKLVEARDGKQMVFDTMAFDVPTEISGFFKLDAWLSINQPDTDFQVLIYVIEPDGRSILITNDVMRARYAQSLREATLVESEEPRLYRFDRFWFTSRLVNKGDRLRLIIGPLDLINTQKNYNSARPVSEQTLADAKPVLVQLHTGPDFPSVLHMPCSTVMD